MFKKFYDGMQNVLHFGRKPSVELESVASVSRILQETLRYVTADAGLITATGKSRLEETNGLSVFEEMSRDAQVKAALSIKKYAVLSGRWSLEPYDDSPEAADQAEFIRWCLKELMGDRGLGLEPVMTAFAYGRSICEIVYESIKYGPHKGKYMVKKLKPKNVGFIDFDMDEFNNINAFLVTNIQGKQKRVDPKKIVHYAWDAEFDNPYGKSDLTSCYSWYWAKKTLYKYLLIYADKYASPIPVFNVAKNLNPTDEAKLDNAAKQYHISNFFKMPKGVELELHQSAGTGGSLYIEAMRECDAQIAKSILAQTLSTNENIKTGTHAQAKVHKEMLEFVLAKVQNDIEKNVVREQLIKRLVDLNFPDPQGYPIFQFYSLDAETLGQVATALQSLIDVTDEFGNPMVNAREPWIREYCGLPKRDEKEFPWKDEMAPQLQAEMDIKQQEAQARMTAASRPVGSPAAGKPPAKAKPGAKPKPKPSK